MKRIFFVAIFLVSIVGFAYSFDAGIVGSEIKVKYDEPTENLDGSPLTDLHHTTIYWSKGTLDIQNKILLSTVSATSVSGGHNVSVNVIIPAQQGEEFNAVIWATASDITGNESPASNSATVRIDRLAPNAPK